MMFGYPVGPGKEVRPDPDRAVGSSLTCKFQLLFLDRELAEKMDPREDRTSIVRARLLSILAERMSVADLLLARMVRQHCPLLVCPLGPLFNNRFRQHPKGQIKLMGKTLFSISYPFLASTHRLSRRCNL